MSILFAITLQAVMHSSTQTVSSAQGKLDQITDGCHAPRTWLTYGRDDEVIFKASPDADYGKIECVLRRLQKSVAPTKLGFIGNEQLSEDK